MMAAAEPMESTAHTMTRRLCAACAAPMCNAVVCDACGRLEARQTGAEPFELLGLDRVFALDETRLGAAFRAIIRRVHPDRFASALEETRELAERLCAEVNHAYQVLSDPVRRADLLLVSAGGPTSSELREVPGNLLAETMVLREAVETAKESKDAATLGRLRANVTARRTEALSRIAAGTSRLAALDDDEKAGLRTQLNAMKYYDNLLLELTVDPLGRAS
jgi:molecular chaperone HscB